VAAEGVAEQVQNTVYPQNVADNQGRVDLEDDLTNAASQTIQGIVCISGCIIVF